ncbi:hypothetical protein G3I24_09685, partial [Micromonospora aurantiaca]|nr:hypothetical protein [Micromonospora aurantiaca]
GDRPEPVARYEPEWAYTGGGRREPVAACGTPEEDRIVIKDPRPSGKSETYAQVRDIAAKTHKDMGGYDCAEFAASIAKDPGMEFPSGKDLYIKA